MTLLIWTGDHIYQVDKVYLNADSEFMMQCPSLLVARILSQSEKMKLFSIDQSMFTGNGDGHVATTDRLLGQETSRHSRRSIQSTSPDKLLSY